MRRSLLRLNSYFSFMDYCNANYRNVGYDKKIIFIAKVGSKTLPKLGVYAINSHPYHKKSPGEAGALDNQFAKFNRIKFGSTSKK